MKLSQMMQRMASLTGKLTTGVATGGSTAYLTDSALTLTAGSYTEGTIFFNSGDLAGTWTRITNHLGNEIDFATQAHAVVAGVQYGIVPQDFNADHLIQAIMASLIEWGDITDTNSTVAVVSDTLVYNLPTGVSDVRRVVITDDAGKEHINYWWDERDGNLVFNYIPVEGTASIYYITQHPQVSATVDINPLIDTQRLLHSSLAYLYGMIVAVHGKDKPIFIELYNKESQLALNASRTDNRQNQRILQRDPKLSW